MTTIHDILKETTSLGPMRVQKIWGQAQILLFEFYAAQYKRIYLICDYSREHFSFHLQLEKPQGPKITTPIVLACRKYLMGENLKFEIFFSDVSTYLVGNIFAHSEEVRIVFDLATRPHVGLFKSAKLLAHSGPSFDFPQSMRKHADTAHAPDDLRANLSQAEIYTKKTKKFLCQQAFLSRQQEILQKLKKLNALKNNLNTDLKKCLNRLEREPEAELLRVNLHIIRKNQTQVVLMDYTCDPPQEKTVKLDPRLSPQQSLEKLFSHVKKARRGISLIQPRLSEVEKEISVLKENLSALVLAGPEASTHTHEIPPDKVSISRAKIKAHKRLPYRIFISSDQIPIWVGKSARDNDDLTLHHARGKEWWFHVRDGSGSHVVVKCSNDALLPNTLLEAAMLAAHFSIHKHDSNPEIIYTRIKNIRKPKGFAPGRVVVEQEKSLIIRMDSQRIATLCAP